MKCAVVIIRSRTTTWVRAVDPEPEERRPARLHERDLDHAVAAAGDVGRLRASAPSTGRAAAPGTVAERVQVPLGCRSQRVEPMMRACSPPCTVIASRLGRLGGVVGGHRPSRGRFQHVDRPQAVERGELAARDGHEPRRRCGHSRPAAAGGRSRRPGPAARTDTTTVAGLRGHRRLVADAPHAGARRCHAPVDDRERVGAPRRRSAPEGSGAPGGRPTRWAPTARSAASPAATGPGDARRRRHRAERRCARPASTVAPNRPAPAAMTSATRPAGSAGRMPA